MKNNFLEKFEKNSKKLVKAISDNEKDLFNLSKTISDTLISGGKIIIIAQGILYSLFEAIMKENFLRYGITSKDFTLFKVFANYSGDGEEDRFEEDQMASYALQLSEFDYSNNDNYLVIGFTFSGETNIIKNTLEYSKKEFFTDSVLVSSNRTPKLKELKHIRLDINYDMNYVLYAELFDYILLQAMQISGRVYEDGFFLFSRPSSEKLIASSAAWIFKLINNKDINLIKKKIVESNNKTEVAILSLIDNISIKEAEKKMKKNPLILVQKLKKLN